ncbi:glycosyltransferase family 4 protein [Dinoroseobacter sp. PD6]|uniref:glycosyltransferase family 4 protein n=1 Tax=Dinoroseobacter sp. PD6 TaxID=3028384 RepID=UPI00237A6FBF|nr:glycosyltransferase family 1 protein [Dinoroseobacter sp. PD6]
MAAEGMRLNQDPLPLLLDVTRLASRIGDRRLSGVDRVEAAYLRFVLSQPDMPYGLVRSVFGYLLLDRAGLQPLCDAVADETISWGRPDLLSRLARHRSKARAGVETTLRALSIARAPRSGLGRMLRKCLPDGAHYLNVGETNFDGPVAMALRGLRRSWIDMVLHDTIPCDFPDLVTPASAARFDKRLRAMRTHADRIITATWAVQQAGCRHLGLGSEDARWCVAPFGLDLPEPDAKAPARHGLTRPYMLALGTLEPRKNITFLLEIWRQATATGSAMPDLVLCGARGWYPAKVFAALDADPLRGVHIHEINDALDPEVAGLIEGAEALLFPTVAEGFGFPPLEAIALGVPVICSDLPVLRETLGALPVYVAPGDSYAWTSKIKQGCAKPDPTAVEALLDRFTWEQHFARVFG